MSKKLIPIVVLVVVAVIVVLLVSKKSPKDEMTLTPETEMSETETPVTTTPKKKVTIIKTTEAPTTPEATPTEDEESMEDVEVDNVETTEPATIDVRIFVNDEKSNMGSVEVNKGDTVRLTLTADPRNNYHGGLEFRSGVVDPIRILNGQSVMITFVAETSFAFTPHWPGFNEPLPYKINIIVKQ